VNDLNVYIYKTPVIFSHTLRVI